MRNSAVRSVSKPRISDGHVPEEGDGRLGDIAYQRILEGLFNRTIPAGAFLSQNELAQLIDVPVQPLRQALRVLKTEGLLEIHARSGIEFLKADIELARSTYQFRSIIERSALRVFVESASVCEIDELIAAHRTILEMVEEHGAAPEVVAAAEALEQRFHGGLIAALRNPMIETTFRRLKNYVALIRLDFLATSPRIIRTIGEHMDVLEACKARDADLAEAALSHHLQAALNRILGMV